jgi:hypothetical protein
VELRIYSLLKAAGVFEIAARWTGESISPPRSQDTLAERIKRYVTVLDAISASLCYLNNTSNRPLYFNVLVKDPRRERVLNVVPISLRSIHILRNFTENMQRDTNPSHDFRSDVANDISIAPAMGQLQEMCLAVLDHLGFVCEGGNRTDGVLSTMAEGSVEALLQVLAVGLISYISSHMGTPTGTVFTQGLAGLTIPAPFGAQIVFRPRRLACLAPFIGDDGWAFSVAGADADFGSEYAISTLLTDFDDLWGPSRAVYAREDSENAVEINTFGGNLVAVNGEVSDELSPLPDEVRCY